jgi:glycosyltransferase involved in cell wall biosynthesis
MHVGITGPVSLTPLRSFLNLSPGCSLPSTYSFPLVGQLAAALVERGWRVTVFAGSYDLTRPECFTGTGVTVWVVPLRRRGAAYDFYREERRSLAPLMQTSGCDLVHAHWTYEFAAAALDSGLPTLVTAHDSPLAIVRHFMFTRGGPFWMARALLAAGIIRRASHLTSVSPYCLEHIRRTLRPCGELRVVPNGISEEWMAAGRARKPKGDGVFRVASVLQGFGRRKNSQKALRAWARVMRTFPAARWTLFGSGYEPGGEAERWARSRGLEGGVVFKGHCPQEAIRKALADETDLLFHPSREESFGMAPLEAMALGIPVLGSRNAGGVPYVVGDAGLLVDVEKVDEMAEALERLGGDPGMREELGRRGRERAGGEFSFEAMVTRYERAYRDVVPGMPGPIRASGGDE